VNVKKLKEFLLSGSTILVYYFFSILLTFYNRYLFVTYQYPLSITIIHLIIKFLIAACLRSILDLTVNSKRCQLSKQPRITLEWPTYLRKIIPLGIASAADIGFSNWSLQYITVTLYTMSKSTVILFILFFALIFKLEKWVILNHFF
jgi:solute carrier family 35 protein C2